MTNRPLTIALSLLLAACSPSEPAKPKPIILAGDGEATTSPVKEVMREIIEPSAQIYWHSSGSVDTATGSESLAPKTPEGWKAAEDSMILVARGGKLLMEPDRARDKGDWMRHAKALIAKAEEAQAAVKARDEDKMFITGGDLYEACTACHKQYLLPFLGPDGRPKKIDENGTPILSPLAPKTVPAAPAK